MGVMGYPNASRTMPVSSHDALDTMTDNIEASRAILHFVKVTGAK
jgi:hypothetical protein